ncbi:MAG: energy-coupling factor transporter transmembrane component T [Muribaculaceae bacterium]|nr:energy-coupling factor transporter transmembrane component T [Muribaculaceae bacterium]
MERIEKAITSLQRMQGSGPESGLHPLCLFVITVAYLVAMLSVPVSAFTMLLWFALYPVVMAALTGLDFTRIFTGSLIALPFALLIGLFNPIYQTRTALRVGSLAISEGWISYLSIILRSMLSVQALLVLVSGKGFTGLCRSLESVGMPRLLSTQLLMVYRYLTVLLQEAVDMTRARRARGYGRRHLSMKMWGAFCGQLFLRTVARAEAVNRAMLARGFDGRMPRYQPVRQRWTLRDTLTLGASLACFALLRFVDISRIFTHLL